MSCSESPDEPDAEVTAASAPPNPIEADAQDSNEDALGSGANTADDRGSGVGVAGVSNETTSARDRGSGAGVAGASTDLDLVDEALDALDQDDLERAEELAERLQGSEPSDEG